MCPHIGVKYKVVQLFNFPYITNCRQIHIHVANNLPTLAVVGLLEFTLLSCIGGATMYFCIIHQQYIVVFDEGDKP